MKTTKPAKKKKKKNYANSLLAVILPLAVFGALGVFFAIERTGLTVTLSGEAAGPVFLPEEIFVPRSMRTPELRCLLIHNSQEEYTADVTKNISFVLDQMSVGTTVVDVGRTRTLPPLSRYKTMVIACEELIPIHLYLFDIFEWVEAGGGLLFAIPPSERVLGTVFNKEMGIEYGLYEYVPQVDAFLETDLLAGGKGERIRWSEKGDWDNYRSGIDFVLSDTAIVHMVAEGPVGPSPMLWENRFGKGRIVVNNNDAMGERWSRGIIAAAYSLTEDAVAWPVINASMIFIDDFPSPISEGYNEFIKNDFNVQNEYFFTHIWFPDMMSLSKKYSVKYSSVFIETYDDNVHPPFETIENTERMKYFGSLFLTEGHEIGLHGYNHQSLAFDNFDYGDELDYNKWQDPEHIYLALSNTIGLQKDLFPSLEMRTYVPPSNVLSMEARAILRKQFPQLNVISGLLVDGIFALEDEFGVAEDGFIDVPRISSDYYPLDKALNEEDPLFWTILNELNLHFVVSHFIHPDDVMDIERGAEKGWKGLLSAFDEFLAWQNQFPIRKLTAQEGAAAVQRFDNINVSTTLSENQIALDISGLYDEAWLLVRINEGAPKETDGGELTHISDNLYLLKAEKPNVVISLGPRGRR
ncbi:MAG: DUF2194 domain-containing protein [Treponema sp.]|nr:DUF2194 domain-containing protein [Treponema sp.]